VSGVDAGLVDRVRTRLAADARPAGAAAGGRPSAAEVAAALRAEGRVFGDAELLDVVRVLRSEIVGLGPLEPLLADPEVTDVLVSGPHQVWLDRGTGLEPAGVRFRDEAAVRRLAQRLAAAAGRRLDDAAPWVDVRLPDGVRMHAVLPPLAPGGTCLSLRVPRRTAFALDELVGSGSLPPAAAEVLARLVAARAAFLVSGGTGTGKTTLLTTLLGLVDPRERLVVVEDSGELQPAHPHVVRLEARPPNLEGVGAVTLRDLVRQALRMRPDRLVVGEVRGGEVVDLLAALNTGHEGGCGTLHANAAADVPARLEALALAAGLGRAALHSQVAAGVQVVVHLTRQRDGLRRLAEVALLSRGDDGLVRTTPALLVPRPGQLVDGPARRELDRLLAGDGVARAVQEA
jgi:pilus assembly protein CpaF